MKLKFLKISVLFENISEVPYIYNKNNEIENCNVFTTRNGSEAIRSNNDGDSSNNLDNLPTF